MHIISTLRLLFLYFITQVWIKIQVVVKQVLEEYLADKSSMKRQNRSGNLLSNDAVMPVATAERLDVNAFFNRRRPNQKKVFLLIIYIRIDSLLNGLKMYCGTEARWNEYHHL